MSSRNVNLTPEHRQQALVLSRALNTAQQLVAGGQTDVESLLKEIKTLLGKQSAARVDYIKVCHQLTLQEQNAVDADSVLLLAIFFGKVRLIDNGYLQKAD